MLKSVSLILLLVYLLIETFVSVAFADQFGFFGLFLEIIVSFILALVMLFNFRGILLHSFAVLRSGRIAGGDVAVATLLQLVGAILILLPGIFADIIGLCLIMGGFLKVGFAPREKKENIFSQQQESFRTKHSNNEDFNYVPDENIIDLDAIKRKNY